MNKVIRKFHEQECIGYRKRFDGSVESVIRGIVSYTDYSAGTLYATAWTDNEGYEQMSDWKEKEPTGIYQAKTK